MKKVTAFVGSAHKRMTHRAVEQFLHNLQALGEIEYEIVTLSDYKLAACRGCRVCFDKGEAFCPLKDDRDVLFEKLDASDGVIFATPNYCFQMSGIMKVFIDRFGYALHRPRYFGKAFTSIVSQGFGGGADILKNLDMVASMMGFNSLKGVAVTGFDPRTAAEQRKIDHNLARQARRFSALLARPADAAPSFSQLMFFRVGRTIMRLNADSSTVDYQYWAGQGWLEADYYYPTRLGALKKAAGSLLDSTATALRAMIS